jgi:preprotein translocase subunit SecF
MEFFHKVSTLKFMGQRRVWYVVSAVLVIGSLVSLATKGLNFGIDFTGGVTVQATYPGAANVEAVTTALQGAGFADPAVSSFGDAGSVLVRLPPLPEGQTSAALREQVLTALRTVDKAADIQQIEAVGPQVGKELSVSALQSLGVTLLLIFIYVALRFHTWRLSLGAIVAAMHDPIVVAGFFSVTGLMFDLPTVSALLAVIGYSLNDTVVVFDRIRERFLAARRVAPADVLDQSINQTLSRTIITSGATFVVVVVLLLLGGPVLKGFSTALVVGIIIGTYSSIYIASAIALDCGLKADDLLPTAVKKPVDDLP